MTSSLKIAVVLVLILPTLVRTETEAAHKCKIMISSLIDFSASDHQQSTYDATITNIGSATAADILVRPSVSLRSITKLKASGKGYELPTSQVDNGGIAVGETYRFTYKVARGKNVRWTVSCSDLTTSTSTQAPTSAPTPNPTSAPTTHSTPTTKAPTSSPTTKAPTSAPTTKAPTSAPTTKAPTSAPTTKAPTKAPTSAPTTKAPTSSPTTKAPTSTPTTTPTPAPINGKACSAGTWWAPAPQTTYQWQLTGTIDTSVDVQMYDIDLFDASTATIATLHSKGRVVICYFSTQYENWRPDASSFTSAVLGHNLDDWAGEKWVDIRSPVLRNIMAARMDTAVSKGCDGLEPDNVDGYTANTGFPLTAADQLDFNKFIAEQAHSRGLSVGLKNDVDQAASLEPYFDWALNEQCKQYDECDTLSSFISAGKAVFNTEYSGSAANVCPYMVNIKFSSLLKTLDLDASIKAQCCTYQSNGCAAVPHQCVSAPLKRIAAVDSIAQPVKEESTDMQDGALVANSAPAISLTSYVVAAAALVAFFNTVC